MSLAFLETEKVNMVLSVHRNHKAYSGRDLDTVFSTFTVLNSLSAAPIRIGKNNISLILHLIRGRSGRRNLGKATATARGAHFRNLVQLGLKFYNLQ